MRERNPNKIKKQNYFVSLLVKNPQGIKIIVEGDPDKLFLGEWDKVTQAEDKIKTNLNKYKHNYEIIVEQDPENLFLGERDKVTQTEDKI